MLDSVVLASLFSVFIGASKEAVPGEGTRENIAVPSPDTEQEKQKQSIRRMEFSTNSTLFREKGRN